MSALQEANFRQPGDPTRPFNWTEQVTVFCEKYAASNNGLQSARAAGCRDPNGAYRRWIKEPAVKERILELREQYAFERNMTRDRISRRLESIAFADVRKMFNEDGTIKKITELEDDEAAALAAFEIVDNGDGTVTTKFKRWDPNKALDSLAKLHGFNEPEVHRLEDDNSVNIVPRGEYKRLPTSEDEIDETREIYIMPGEKFEREPGSENSSITDIEPE